MSSQQKRWFEKGNLNSKQMKVKKAFCREAANSELSTLLSDWIVEQVELPDPEIETNRPEDEKNTSSVIFVSSERVIMPRRHSLHPFAFYCLRYLNDLINLFFFNLCFFSFATASPHPNHVGRACLKLKVYVRPPGKSRS